MALMLLLVSGLFRVSVFLIRVSVIRVVRIFVILGIVFLRRLRLFGWRSRQDTLLLSVMREILETQRAWTERMLALEEERLRLERLRLEGAQPLSNDPMGMLRISEEEQDADWALKHGIISPEEYNTLLSSAGLAPTDIQFD